jgi:hypothetical protein
MDVEDGRVLVTEKNTKGTNGKSANKRHLERRATKVEKHGNSGYLGTKPCRF